jgi:DNA helicase-4
MRLRKGPYGEFWACSNYRKGSKFSCEHKEKQIDLKQAKHKGLPDEMYIT